MSVCSLRPLLRALRLPAAIAAAFAPVSIGGAAGGLDAAFNPAVNSHPNGIGVQPDGKIVVTSSPSPLPHENKRLVPGSS